MTTLTLPPRTKGGRRKFVPDKELAEKMRPYFRRAIEVTGLPVRTFTAPIEQSLAMTWPRTARAALIYVLACQGFTDKAIGRATDLCATHVGQILPDAVIRYNSDPDFQTLCNSIAST